MKSLVIDAVPRQLFGIPIHAVTMTQALDIVDRAIATRQRVQIGVVNAAKIVNMARDPALRADVLRSDLILADGIAVVWASRILGRPLPERVTGIDLMTGMLERGRRSGYSVYCLGATEDISKRVAERIRDDYPGVRLAGRHHGYFSREEESAVAAEIAASRPDILLVAMTSPKKENFMAKWIDHTDVPVFHGVGGSFDVMAGKVRRAPVAWQRLGLEWFYRLKQEPTRLFKRYLVTNSLFCTMVAKEFWQGLRRHNE